MSGRYLETDPRRVAECRQRLDRVAGDTLKVGIAWLSKPQNQSYVGRRKSIELQRWEPILRVPSVTFVNLQYGDTAADVRAVRERLGVSIYSDPVVDRFNDLDGLAALIDSLDLVVTISNVTAHFAGALGKDTRLLVRASPLWYWGRVGERALLYESVRIHRQQRWGEWEAVIAAAAEALIEKAGGRGGAGE